MIDAEFCCVPRNVCFYENHAQNWGGAIFISPDAENVVAFTT
jgi:hypothetical protein